MWCWEQLPLYTWRWHTSAPLIWVKCDGKNRAKAYLSRRDEAVVPVGAATEREDFSLQGTQRRERCQLTKYFVKHWLTQIGKRNIHLVTIMFSVWRLQAQRQLPKRGHCRNFCRNVNRTLFILAAFLCSSTWKMVINVLKGRAHGIKDYSQRLSIIDLIIPRFFFFSSAICGPRNAVMKWPLHVGENQSWMQTTQNRQIWL